ncbi:helix-turn-helix domain-containing protein [uncultured Tateyamaria sp.]|uniref:AlbA family DNA-binding domain-containing protein n=1 Tax=uncultured Tateyamaria sp. TaxID=455651 RepID=UPI0026053446|nr:ATP-binding protein [uncultured Tateyamaria sp.]
MSETVSSELEATLNQIVATGNNQKINCRESRTLEFKEQFNFSALADYFRDFAAFANNAGGYLVFGVTDSPRTAAGLSSKALDSFEKLDPEKLTGLLNDCFSAEIVWETAQIEVDGKSFAAFHVFASSEKPIICTKDEGKSQTLKNGSIYYRYGGRTQVIKHGELQAIINERIEQTNAAWIDHVQQVGIAGPKKAVLLSESDLNATDSSKKFVVDRELASKLKFIKKGHFKEDATEQAMRLVGDVTPIEAVEVEKIVEANLFEKYPYTAKALASEVAGRVSGVKQNAIWTAITSNGLKGNPEFSVYNFKNPAQRQQYEENGAVCSTTPVLYNGAAIDLLVEVLSQ